MFNFEENVINKKSSAGLKEKYYVLVSKTKAGSDKKGNYRYQYSFRFSHEFCRDFLIRKGDRVEVAIDSENGAVGIRISDSGFKLSQNKDSNAVFFSIGGKHEINVDNGRSKLLDKGDVVALENGWIALKVK